MRIVIGISGGIAAYKVPALIRLLTAQGCAVKVVLTPYARGLVGEEALRTVSGNTVYRDDAPVSSQGMDHISLADWAEYFLVCPATANTLAKIAHGIGDNLLTTLALTLHGPKLIVAPAMNTRMWENPATRDNIEVLTKRGVRVLPVDSGELACGTEGPGRMLAIEEIARYVASLRAPRLLENRRVLISSGPTQEPLDDVRVLTNRSSGRMGAALARAALNRGAKVTVVSGPAPVALPSGVDTIPVTTALEMKAALEREFGSCDICILAAAVSDFRPQARTAGKLSRDMAAAPEIRLTANPDIAASLGSEKGRQFLVCFSLESGSAGEDRARDKMARKKCDMIAVNHVETSLEKESTEIVLLFPDGSRQPLPHLDKSTAAERILDSIADRLSLP